MGWHYLKYDIVHVALAGMYVPVFVVSLVLFLRFLAKPQLTWQRLFHPVLMTGAAMRIAFFVLQALIRENQAGKFSNSANNIFNVFPSFLFFTAYLIVLWLWVDIYHKNPLTVCGLPVLQPLFWFLSSIMYVILTVLLVLVGVLSNDQDNIDSVAATDPTEKILMVYLAAAYLVTSLGYLIYGVAIYRRLSANTTTFDRTRWKIVRRVLVLTSLVVICFSLRAALVTADAFYGLSRRWWFDGVYFTVLEIAPLLLMMVILHVNRNPGQRDTDVEQYQHVVHQQRGYNQRSMLSSSSSYQTEPSLNS
eukprot:TRINITY_DN2960_c0_g1_i1.p1 TRINITY_DN2960_c0_g1~~TRINITY_DN2960_c0_g1_i1.p1  ORF type:complete len:306 (+),score=44.15 TRINITY_DN2960_c0_g1_i1:159-1076(+)